MTPSPTSDRPPARRRRSLAVGLALAALAWAAVPASAQEPAPVEDPGPPVTEAPPEREPAPEPGPVPEPAPAPEPAPEPEPVPVTAAPDESSTTTTSAPPTTEVTAPVEIPLFVPSPTPVSLPASLVSGPVVAPGPALEIPESADRRGLEEQLLEATVSEIGLFTELGDLQAQRALLDAKVVELDAAVITARERLGESEDRREEAVAEAARQTGRLARTEGQLRDAVVVLQDQAVSAFLSGAELGDAKPDPVFRAGDLRELGAAETYEDAVVEHQNAVVDDVVELRDQADQLKRGAEAASEAAVAARNVADSQRIALELDQAAVTEARNQVRLAAEAQVLLLAQAQLQRMGIEAELVAFDQLSTSIGAFLSQYQAAQLAAPAAAGTFINPTPGAVVTSVYGPRVHPIFGNLRLHAGLDLSAATGTPILAAADGFVVAAGVRGGYGNAVVLDHGNSLATLYGHQSQILVAEGQLVRRGDVVGLVGSTGNSTGPHLHFEVRVRGTPVDPFPYL